MIFKKIENFFLLFLILIKSIFRGKSKEKIINPKKILIVDLAKLGDMVCITPMFRAIKEKYPTCKVYVIGNLVNKDVLANNSDVDEYITFDNNIWQLIKKINKEKIDFGCTPMPHYISLAMLYLSNIPLVATPKIVGGFSSQLSKPYNKIIRSNLVVTIDHHIKKYAPGQYLYLLEPVGINSENTDKHLAFSDQADQKVKELFKKNSVDLKSDFIIGIFPSVGNKIKLWPAQRFAKLADHLYQKYQAKIVVTGGQSDTEQVESMLSHLDKNTKVVNFLNKINIDELKAAISKMSLFICVDTGPIYIAEAFNVPTLNIVGPMDENTQPAIGKYNKIVKAKREKPAIYIMNARVYDYAEARRQSEDISVDMVIKELDSLVNDLKNSKQI